MKYMLHSYSVAYVSRSLCVCVYMWLLLFFPNVYYVVQPTVETKVSILSEAKDCKWNEYEVL